LRQRGARVAVIEREPRIGAHQTSHSSGVIHAGVYYAPGSLKARLCVAGAAELYAYCEERRIPALRNGKLIVATAPSELAGLDELERRARANGVPGLRRVGRDEIAEIEPHVRGIAALHSPNTGVTDFSRVATAFAEDVDGNGGSVSLGCAVEAVVEDAAGVTVRHARGMTRSTAVVICAGAWADRLARSAGAPAEPRIVPFRGGYLRLRPERAHLVRANLYPVADPELPFLGDTLAWPGTWRLLRRHWRAGLIEIGHAASRRAFVGAARRLVPELRAADFVAGPAGIRAQAVGRDGSLVDDFVVSCTERALYVRNAPSPAATSSLPLARLIADQAEPLLR
jgi:L-2-hydroxyglutarate oxidase